TWSPTARTSRRTTSACGSTSEWGSTSVGGARTVQPSRSPRARSVRQAADIALARAAAHTVRVTFRRRHSAANGSDRAQSSRRRRGGARAGRGALLRVRVAGRKVVGGVRVGRRRRRRGTGVAARCVPVRRVVAVGGAVVIGRARGVIGAGTGVGIVLG